MYKIGFIGYRKHAKRLLNIVEENQDFFGDSKFEIFTHCVFFEVLPHDSLRPSSTSCCDASVRVNLNQGLYRC